MVDLFSLFCRHEWKTVVQEKTKTQLDVLRSNGAIIPVPANDHQTDKMTRYKHIDIFTKTRGKSRSSGRGWIAFNFEGL